MKKQKLNICGKINFWYRATLKEIQEKMRQLKKEGKLKVLISDYHKVYDYLKKRQEFEIFQGLFMIKLTFDFLY